MDFFPKIDLIIFYLLPDIIQLLSVELGLWDIPAFCFKYFTLCIVRRWSFRYKSPRNPRSIIMFVANIVSISRRDALYSHMQKQARREKLNGSITAPSRMYNRTMARNGEELRITLSKDKKSGRERLIGALACDTLLHQEVCIHLWKLSRVGTLVPARAYLRFKWAVGRVDRSP